MLKGSHTLFKDIFHNDVPVITKQRTKGRNSELNEARNECIINRYYYYGATTPGITYQQLICKVAAEFFLSPFTITEIIEANSSLLKHLKIQRPDIKLLQQKWPHLVWTSTFKF